MPSELLSDGTVSWIGGMDTSRNPTEISQTQYQKGSNVIIPSSLGGIKVRFGLHCCHLEYDDEFTKEIYRNGNVQGAGSFSVNDRIYLICLVDGYVLKFTKTAGKRYFVENLNCNNQNTASRCNGWVITIPNGCIVNNGFDLPIIVTQDGARRSKPENNEIGIGQMGVYVQHRLFYVDQSGRRILASDFNQPTKFTLEDTNIFGFMCPDQDETIVAITKQKSILGTVDGGNLIWSSNRDIYSADIRGTRSDWANTGSRVGKVTETIPGVSAVSSYSFEPFNTNIYFRNQQFGMADVKQSEYQFTNLDVMNSQAIEASYYFDNDTDWMLDRCWTKSCNKRLFTTVAPERNDEGYVFWNGLLSFHPSALYSNQQAAPRRFESVFTGVRPWCLTVINQDNKRDTLMIHSFDKDGVTRLYEMDEDSDYDTNESGHIVEIEGFIETRAYNFGSPYLLKSSQFRSYKLNPIERTTNVEVLCRPEPQGEWVSIFSVEHCVIRNKINNNLFEPTNHKPQTRSFVNMPSEKFSQCHNLGMKFFIIQYRFEFKGPINLDSFVVSATLSDHDKTIKSEGECRSLIYTYRPDYGYTIVK